MKNMTKVAYDGETMNELADRAEKLQNDEEAWTWLDYDPDIAWRSPDSYHGKLRAIYQDAGWEPCYHSGSNSFYMHYNVKIGGARWRGIRDGIDALNRDLLDEDRLDAIIQDNFDHEIETWWWDDLRYAPVELGVTSKAVTDLYSCGRSDGYVQLPPKYLRYPEFVLKFGDWLRTQVEGYSSYEQGRGEVERAIEEYDMEKLYEMASPRENMTW